MADNLMGLERPARAEIHPSAKTELSFWMTALLATSCGLLAANVYYSQSIAGPIALSLGLSPATTGLIVTFTQIGFGVGLLFVVPLGDLVENRQLVLFLTGAAAVALLGAGLATNPNRYLFFALLIGLASVGVQVLVPYAAHLAPEAVRGRVVGDVMSGLMVGILLARPVSSFITHLVSWRLVFYISAAFMSGLVVTLGRTLPKRVPVATASYADLLKSMWHLALGTPILQLRASYQFFLFGAFSLFWTTVPLLLSGPAFRMSQNGIALFALVGGAGVVAAPTAGRLADKGLSQAATALAIIIVAAAFLVTSFVHAGTHLGLALLVSAAILLDFGMTANLTLGQRAIFVLGAQWRSRLNGLYMSAFFAGGAIGSALGGWAYAAGGWPLTSWVGFGFPIAALVLFIIELGVRSASKHDRASR
jgi:predicted MFS family arabinose efflux permease